MRLRYLFLLLLVLICCAVLFLLHNPYPGRFSNPEKKSVYIHYQDGKYTLFRFGKPFFIKGAAGTTHLAELKLAGGNTIRVWDTLGLDKVLADAEKNDIAVVAGLPMPYNENMDAFYNDDKKVQVQFEQYRKLIIKYRNSRSLLCWCLGNELAYPLKPNYFKFYKVFNRLVDMIHREDPDHPVTTTVMNFQTKYILNIKLWTHIDFISFNIFGAIRNLNSDLHKFRRLWNGPFMITEWAMEGPWQGVDQTAWNAFIEPTSDKKADQYRELYERYMPLKDTRFLGSLAFYWGYRQETTPTWFSLFDKEGNKSAAVNVMQYLWTGHWPAQKVPGIKYMLVDKKGAKDNLLYNPGAVINAQVFLKDTTANSNLRFEWFVQPEDWFRVKHYYNQKEKQSLSELAISEKKDHFAFHAPENEGPYRVYVKVYNDKGYFATCNTPFYVVGAK